MKSISVILALICITALLDITVGDDEIANCFDDPSVCSDLQCCLFFDSDNSSCTSLSRQAEQCYSDYNADEIRTAVYLFRCPCMKGLTCVENKPIYVQSRGTPFHRFSNEDDAAESVYEYIQDYASDRNNPRYCIRTYDNY